MALHIKTILFLYLVSFAFGENTFECNPHFSLAIKSGANDVVVVKKSQGFEATPFHMQVGKFANFYTTFHSLKNKKVEVFINGQRGSAYMYTTSKGSACFRRSGKLKFTFSHEEWKKIKLEKGKNEGFYRIKDLGVEVPFSVYYYEKDIKLVVSDIDGTITISDTLGYVADFFGSSAHQKYVIHLFRLIRLRGYHLVYLTARALDQAKSTRNYMFKKLKRLGLPEGPLFMTPKPLKDVIVEVTTSSPRKSKADTLLEIFMLLVKGAEAVAGAYGNRHHDTEAYEDAGIPPSKIYIVNPQGVVRRADGKGGDSSYKEQIQNIDKLYPWIKQT